MSNPTWITPAGSIGTFQEGTTGTLFTFQATPNTLGDTLTYSLLNGKLADGASLNSNGTVTGTLAEVNADTTSEFTIRITESGTTPGIADRTFSMKVQGPDAPTFVQPPGTTLVTTNDSTWVDYSVQVLPNDPRVTIIVTVVEGSLPSGLQMDPNGRIKGYSAIPSTASETISFKLRATSSNGLSSSDTEFRIVVNRQSTNRQPAILNNQPLTLVIPTDDPYYPYYLNSTFIGKLDHDNQFIFKIIGYNFQDVPVTESPYTYGLTYTFTGNTGTNIYPFQDAFDTLEINTSEGWINGKLKNIGTDINTYSFTVRVALRDHPTVFTERTFTFIVIGTVSDVIIWNTPSNLGSMKNGDICDLSVNATFGKGVNDGRYIYVPPDDGDLYKSIPPNLEILNDGNISGRITFGDPPGTYTFDVKAYSPQFQEIYSIKTFTLVIEESYQDPPYDTVYLHALMPASDRGKIERLLTDITATQSSNIYRITDEYFGVASSINVMQMFGIETVPAEDFYTVYKFAVNENFYWRNITLGTLKTAVAKDQNGVVIYEVVYSQVIDDLVNNNGVSISKEIIWPQTINRGDGFSYDGKLYPASLPNMNVQLEDVIGMYNDSNLLPLWMRSQQFNGSVIGYTPCWVLCYTKPGKSAEVLASIQEYLSENDFTLNQISFELDRFEVDRSLTYAYQGDGQTIPNQDTVRDDSKDNIVYYPRKTILKKT